MFTVPGMCLTMLRIFGDLLYLATDLKLTQSSKIDDIKDVAFRLMQDKLPILQSVPHHQDLLRDMIDFSEKHILTLSEDRTMRLLDKQTRRKEILTK